MWFGRVSQVGVQIQSAMGISNFNSKMFLTDILKNNNKETKGIRILLNEIKFEGISYRTLVI